MQLTKWASKVPYLLLLKCSQTAYSVNYANYKNNPPLKVENVQQYLVMLKKSSFIIHRNVSNNWIRSPGKVRQRLRFKPKNVQTRNNFSKYFKHNTAAAAAALGMEELCGCFITILKLASCYNITFLLQQQCLQDKRKALRRSLF